VFVFNKLTKRFSPLPIPVDPKERLTFTDLRLDQDRLWLFALSEKPFSYHIPTKHWDRYPIPAGIEEPNFYVRNSLIDRSGRLWLDVYPGGLFSFSAEKKCFALDKLSRNEQLWGDVTSFTEDQAGNFWFSANGQGVSRYNPRNGRYDQWTESEGLAYDHCLAALPDRFGNVWVGAYNKCSVFQPDKKQFLNLTIPYNEDNLEYTNRLYPLRNGHILAALKGYLVEFFPEKLTKQAPTLPEKVLISQVSFGMEFLQNHSGLSSINLKAGESGFAVHFGALTSAWQTPFEFYYQLDGYEDWKPAGDTRYAVYTKIPGGDYTFRLKGVASDGRETPVSTLNIHIDAYFYQTTWFWGIVAVIMLGLLIGFLRYRADQFERVHDLQVQATRLERDKSEIQYQNLINHLNPHFLFNSLTSLNSLININPREASAFLGKLSIIYRYILQNKDKDLVPLENEIAFVQNYIALQKSRFDDALQITMDVPHEYMTRLIVPVTIQNLLENAIKHNTIDEEDPLVIRIYPESEFLCVINNLQKKTFVETSNKQGLASLKSMYHYLSRRDIEVIETDTHFLVKVPLI
jgi:hypothetical protein